MKRLTKILSAVLLLSVVLSVFAVFSFGADASGPQPTVIYDMETELGTKNGSITGSKTNAPVEMFDADGNSRGKSISLLRHTTEAGDPYWQYRILGADQGDGTYKNPHNPSNTFFQMAPATAKTVVKTTEEYGEKNMDYMVIDFDLSTDGYLGGYFYFHSRWYNASGDSSQANYTWFNGSTTDAFKIQSRTYNNNSKIYEETATAECVPVGESNWVGVTIIYNFSDDDSANWTAHVYIDGVYAGDILPCKTDAVKLQWFRISYKTTLEAPESTINFANFTVTSFPTEYQGDLTAKADKLADTTYTLAEFSDLAYTDETPAPLKVATVEREGNTYDVYDTDLLDASLVDGDKVTLHQSLFRSIIVPEGANIEFDTNGNWMAKPTAVDYAKADIAVRDLIAGTVLGYGKNGGTTAEEGDTTTATPGINDRYSGATPSWNSASVKTSKLKYTAKEDSNENPYLQMNAPDTSLVTGSEWHYLGYSGSKVSLANMEYIVIDVDLSTDTVGFEEVIFNTRFYNGSTSISGNGAFSPAYFYKDGKFGVGVYNSSPDTALYLDDTHDSGKWTNITYVYEMTAESSTDWKLHAYIDGIYMGVVSTSFKTVTDFYFIRLQPETPSANNATNNYANWSIKEFTNDYTGNLGDSLGKTDVNLADIPDLAYCLENDYDVPVVVEESYPEVEDAIKEHQGTDVKITLLNDATFTSTAVYKVEDNVVVDLNGKTLTTDSTKGSAHNFQPYANLVIRNGKINFKTSYATNLALMPSSSTNVTFLNIDELTVGSKANLVEQRSGRLVFKNVKGDDLASTLVSMRGGNTRVALSFIDCEIDAVGRAIYVANTSSSQKRYGSLNNSIYIENSVFTAGDVFASVQTYASEQGSVADGAFVPTAGHGDNNNVVDITIVGGSVTAAGAFIENKLTDLRNDAHDVDGDDTKDVLWADNFKANLTVNVIGTPIKAKNLVSHTVNNDKNGVGVYPDDVLASGVTAVNHTAMTLDTTIIDITDDAMTSRDERDVFGTITVTILGETPMSTDKVAEAGTEGVTLTTDPDLYLVPRSNPDALGYALTSNVKAYPYIIGEDEYEFYWYNGDPVTVDKIPVDLPTGSSYFKYEWAPTTDINGAYYAIMSVDLPVKANLTLYSDFTFNLYLPTDLGDDCYGNILVNGVKTEAVPVNSNGTDYMMLRLAGISPAVAADGIDVSLTIYGTDGSSVPVTKQVSVISYIESILENATAPAKDKKLAASLLNYIDKAYALEGKENSALDALTESAEYTSIALDKTTAPAPVNTVSELGIFAEVGLTLAGDFRYIFKTADDFEGNIIITYYKGGQKVMETRRMKGGEELVLELKAQDLLSDITFRYAGESGGFNLAAYLAEVEELETVDQSTLDLIDALWIYSECAAEFKAS